MATEKKLDTTPAPLAPTATHELPDQLVMEFFSQGIPITHAPKDVVLKKSNAAIKMVSSLGLLELKIIDACLFIAKPRMLDNVLHSADLEYFKWLVSFNSQNRDHLKKSISKIQQTLIQINIINEAKPSEDLWHSTVLLYDVSITGGRIYFRVPESVRQPLVNPQSWTFLSFRIKNRFTSEYAYRLYERCRADQFKGATDFWEVDDFRKLMNVADLYQKFQDLHKRVIKPAVDQINEHSDIYITPDFRVRGRTKTHIRFIIEENPNAVKFVEEREKLPVEIFEALKKEFGFSNTEIDDVAEYPLDYLAEKIEFTRYRMKTAKTPIRRPNLYLLKALKEDLQFNVSEIERIKSDEHQQKSLLAQEAGKEESRAETSKNREVFEAFMGLSETEQAPIIEAFKASPFFESIRAFASGDKFSLKSTIVKTNLIQFLRVQSEEEVS